jgi:putative peptidoglycan lipid II flippase
MADKWILSHYAAADKGAITLLTNAKSLFNAPLSVIGMAAGAASLPFFSSLYTQSRFADFNSAVNRSVSRLIAVALLVSAWMVALAIPIVGFLRGGSYTHADAFATARYFALFALSLALWSAQGIYARAFYAARNTLTPAISGTVVTCVSIPIYALLFHRFGVIGLAVASDLGILAHTLALAILLHHYRLVSLASLDFAELARATLAAVISFIGAAACVRLIPTRPGHTGDFILLTAGSLVWIFLSWATLTATGSALPRQILRRA